MANLNIKDGIDTINSLNAIVPTGALMMKASAASLLTSYTTDAQCIAAGYIPCDGRALNASTYPAYQDLYNVIGNIYGGTNNTNFTVPNLRTSRRYIFGQSTAVSGIYTPSFSANTSNATTHRHVTSISPTGINLATNAIAGSHTHSVSYNFNNADTTHTHAVAHTMNGHTTGGGAGTTLTKADGTGTAAGAAHTHTVNSYVFNGTSGSGTTAHAHSGSGTSTSHTEPTHSHSISTTSIQTAMSSPIEIPYVNVLYFIKI